VARSEDVAPDRNRVAGVWATLVAAHEIRPLRQQVDDLALALVSPLRADDDGRGHAPSLPRPAPRHRRVVSCAPQMPRRLVAASSVAALATCWLLLTGGASAAAAEPRVGLVEWAGSSTGTALGREFHSGFVSAVKRLGLRATVREVSPADDPADALEFFARQKYDLIVMNASWHWRAYGSLLLGQGFQQTLRDALAPGGVVAFNTTGSMDVLYTATQTFPCAGLYSNFVFASDHDLRADLQHNALRIAQVAAYALDNPDEIAFGTAASIADAAGVQPSTLVRFAQHLGFDGFTSLQSVFRQRLRERNSS